MNYVSTRGRAPVRDFAGVLLAGLAEDGGLYVPEAWPERSPAEWRGLRGLPYAELAAEIIRPFTEPAISHDTLRTICRQAYAGFGHPAIVPLVQIDHAIWVQELFHGPTLAFKDLAMQVLGRLFEHVLAERGERVTIVAATSGDTGSAAIEAFANRARVDIAVLHPLGRTSEVQRRQMTTVLAPNVANAAIEGSFDDCQDLVKAMFADAGFRDEMRLSAVNSINWARIAAQIPYYVAAALALGAPDREVSFAVPTGNFGNVLAAWAARRMGLPIARLIAASNRNDILTRFLDRNDMTTRDVAPSLSPSMDIQVSSNFERLLFELLGRDGERTAATMQAFRATGRMPIDDRAWREASQAMSGLACDDSATLAEIAFTYRAAGYLADPHTATGIAAARHYADSTIPIVVAGTAHPAKFPKASQQAVGVTAPLPEQMADLLQREERLERLPNQLGPVKDFIRAFVHRNRP